MDLELQNKLDRIVEILKNSVPREPLGQIEQISHLIVLKLLDEGEVDPVYKVRHGVSTQTSVLPYFSSTERFRWSSWRSKRGKQLWEYVNNRVFPYHASLDDYDLVIADYFRDAVLLIKDVDLFNTLVDEIDEFTFNQLTPQARGQIFEYFISSLIQTYSRPHLVPKAVRQLIVEMVAPKTGNTVFAPMCGVGQLLAEVISYLQGSDNYSAANRIEPFIFGSDPSRQKIRISLTNVLMHGLRHAQLKHDDITIGNRYSQEISTDEEYDIIISEVTPTAPRSRRSLYLSDHAVVIMNQIMDQLASGGICALIVPDYVLERNMRDLVKVRKRLVEEYELLAVIALHGHSPSPNRLHGNSSILIFRNPFSTGDLGSADTVWFYELDCISDHMRSVTNNRHSDYASLSQNPSAMELLAKWQAYKESRFTQPPGVNANSVLELGSEGAHYWWLRSADLADNFYCLSSAIYRPIISGRESHDDPVTIVEEFLKIEKKIVAEMETLNDSLKDNK